MMVSDLSRFNLDGAATVAPVEDMEITVEVRSALRGRGEAGRRGCRPRVALP